MGPIFLLPIIQLLILIYLLVLLFRFTAAVERITQSVKRIDFTSKPQTNGSGENQ